MLIISKWNFYYIANKTMLDQSPMTVRNSYIMGFKCF